MEHEDAEANEISRRAHRQAIDVQEDAAEGIENSRSAHRQAIDVQEDAAEGIENSRFWQRGLSRSPGGTATSLIPQFQDNHVSSKGISEDEDWDDDWSANCITSDGPARTKGGIQVLSQLEMLKEAYGVNSATKMSIRVEKSEMDIHNGLEVEIPLLKNDDDFCFGELESVQDSDDDIVSDDDNNSQLPSGATKNDVANTCLGASRHVEMLIHTIDKARGSSTDGLSSKQDRYTKGVCGQAKPKSLFRFRLPKEAFISAGDKSLKSASLNMTPQTQEVSHRLMEKSMADVFGNIHGKEKLLENHALSRADGGEIDDDDLPEASDSWPSTDDEGSSLNLKAVIHQKSIAEQLQEVFGLVNAERPNIGPRQAGMTLFKRLQKVTQREKERDADFLRRKEETSSMSDRDCIDVTILSKYLEGKLTVCLCSFAGERSLEDSYLTRRRDEVTNLTVIFSSRISNDVELEVGNSVRIHSPWKEIYLDLKDETIILSTYFSQI